ncbi:MAG TPA: DUF3142 domain-containing protein [Blastocatellia bacterium]|nr:DUF3142 domain-containing protein [Blastocatellia bacterium]
MRTASQKSKRNLIAGVVIAALMLASIFFFGRFDTEVKALLSSASSEDRMSEFPEIILWAWERPEDLRFINTDEVGVAFLARTIYLQNDKAIIRPRLQPLSVLPETKLIAVARIESNRSARLSPAERAQAVTAIAELARNETVAAIQIDFDARSSEREFYRDLLTDLRRELPSRVRLSITALASWCMGDNWLTDLPIDEAVPMLFRMGVDRPNILARLEAGTDFSARIARHSLGLSTDESLTALPAGRRVYVFNPRSWSKQSAQKIVEEVRKWQQRD